MSTSSSCFSILFYLFLDVSSNFLLKNRILFDSPDERRSPPFEIKPPQNNVTTQRIHLFRHTPSLYLLTHTQTTIMSHNLSRLKTLKVNNNGTRILGQTVIDLFSRTLADKWWRKICLLFFHDSCNLHIY